MSASQTVTVNHGYPRTVISHTISEAIEIIGKYFLNLKKHYNLKTLL